MSEFIRDKAGATEAQQKKALAFLFAQDSVGLATDGVLAGLQVTQTGTASANVLVGAGSAVVQDTVGNGVSQLVNDTPKTLDVLTANPMGATPRNDIVVFDSATTSIRVIVGTPNAVPTDPTVPATAVALARLRHAASATTVPTSQIDDLRVFTRLAGAPADSGWVTLTLASGYTAVAGYTLQYRLIGSQVFLRGAAAYNGGGTIATLPVGARPASNSWLGSAHSNDGSFEFTLLVASTGVLSIPATYYNGTVTTGEVLPIFGSFLIG